MDCSALKKSVRLCITTTHAPAKRRVGHIDAKQSGYCIVLFVPIASAIRRFQKREKQMRNLNGLVTDNNEKEKEKERKRDWGI